MAELFRVVSDFEEGDAAVLALTLLRRMDIGGHFAHMAQHPTQLAQILRDFIAATPPNMRQVLDELFFKGREQEGRSIHLLGSLVREFASIDLHPDRVDAQTMGAVFVNLMMRSIDESNRYFPRYTMPPDVAQLTVQLLMEPDREALSQGVAGGSAPATISIFDPACGYGQLLIQAQNWLVACNEHVKFSVFGADSTIQNWAMTSAVRYMYGAPSEEVAKQITCSNILINPPFPGQVFDYLLTQPPFCMDWANSQPAWQAKSTFFQQTSLSPRTNDAALVFLLYLVEKFAPYQPGDATCRGTRAAIILTAAPLCMGAAGTGESEIRRWLIENDFLEAVVALPTGVFNYTTMGTFICVLTNRKTAARKGKIQLIDAREQGKPLLRRLAGRNREVNTEMRQSINANYASLTNIATSCVLDSLEFGYRRILLMRPLRLRFQITPTTKATFLNTCPELFDAMIALEAFFGNTPHDNWNEVWRDIQRLVKLHGGWRTGKYGAGQRKLMRQVFTTVNPEAKPVLARSANISPESLPALFLEQTLPLASQIQLTQVCGLVEHNGKWLAYEVDTALRDWIDIPLAQPVLRYFVQKIAPFVPDAWIDPTFRDDRDGGIGKVGYAIDFQKHFPPQQEAKSLAEIDAALADAKNRLLDLLQGNTP